MKLSIGALLLFSFGWFISLSINDSYWFVKYGPILTVKLLPVVTLTFFIALIADSRWHDKRIISLLMSFLLVVSIIVFSLSFTPIISRFAISTVLFIALVIGMARQSGYIINLSISFSLAVFTSLLFMPINRGQMSENVSQNNDISIWLCVIPLIFLLALVIERKQGNGHVVNLIVSFMLTASVLFTLLLFYPIVGGRAVSQAQFDGHLYYTASNHEWRVGMNCTPPCGVGYVYRLHRCNAYGFYCEELYTDPNLYEKNYEAILQPHHITKTLQFLVNDEVIYNVKN